jgi:hypothetical protein
MRKKIVILTAAITLIAVVGAIVFANASTAVTTQTSNQQSTAQTMQYMEPFFGQNHNTYFNDPAFLGNLTAPDNITLPGNFAGPGNFMRGMHERRMMGSGPEFSGYATENATTATIEGSIVTEYRNLLILNTTAGQITVQVPREWTVDSQIISGAELFNGTFASSGQTITLQVLENNLFSNTSFSINQMLCYAATNATGATANAVLPFNIQPSS